MLIQTRLTKISKLFIQWRLNVDSPEDMVNETRKGLETRVEDGGSVYDLLEYLKVVLPTTFHKISSAQASHPRIQVD